MNEPIAQEYRNLTPEEQETVDNFIPSLKTTVANILDYTALVQELTTLQSD